jgi:hypothetical protein
MAVGVNTKVFWNVLMCRLLDRYKCSGVTCRLHLQGGRPHLYMIQIKYTIYVLNKVAILTGYYYSDIRADINTDGQTNAISS